jgi:GT2 family glycosyltransferase
LVRKAAFESVGGFDEGLVTCEDCELGYKLAPLGRLILDPRTTAAHHGESRTLGELFLREAWRSRGNVRLAVRRPGNVSNWFSMLAPLGLVAGFLIAILGWLAAAFAGGLRWPWAAASLAIALFVAAAVLHKGRPKSLSAFLKLSAVFSTYLAGRAAGLFWPFRRVHH